MNIKKKLIIVFLMAILIFTTVACIVYSKTGIVPKDSIINSSGVKINLSTNLEVALKPSVVHQNNVFCVQHGMDSKATTYKATKEYTVEDPALAYILRFRDDDNIGDENWVTPTQIALWQYLYKSKSDDVDTILGTLDTDPVESTWYYYEEGMKIYNDAIEHARDVNNVSVRITNFTKNKSSISFTVSGDYDCFTVNYNGEKYKDYNQSTSERITISTGSDSEAKVEVTAYKKTYDIKYRILKNAQSQRLMVVTENNGEINGPAAEASRDEELSIDVSLQKYIVAVGSEFDESGKVGIIKEKRERYYELTENSYGYTGTTRRNKKATDSSGTAISKNNTASGFIKSANPEKISKGDYVVYKIDVYNNLDTDATVWIRDRISKYGRLVGVYDNRVTGTLKFYNKITTVDPENPYDSNQNCNFYKWSQKIEGSKSDSYFVVVQYDTFTSKKINNKAFIKTDRNESNYRTQDYDYIEMVTDVSLQKYITAVGATFNTSTGTLSDKTYGYNMSRRNLRMATDKSNNKIYSTSNSSYASNNNKNTATNNYKVNDPIEIKNGDYVVYKIEIYNNKNVSATVTIKDRIAKSGTLMGVYDCHSSTNSLQFTTKKSNDDVIMYSENDNHRCYKWQATVAANRSNSFWVVVKYDNPVYDTVIDNRAYINNNYNESEYNTEDYDYIILRNYSVSLEKYVSNVNGSAPSPTRDGHPTYKQNGFSKQNNPVPVEKGDTVTYTIKLTNTGKNPVQITQIYDKFGYLKNDTFSVKNEDGTKNVGLKHVSISASTGYTASISNYEYGSPIYDRYNKYLINISGDSIQPNASIYIYMTYEVDIPYEITNQSYTLFNEAGIVAAGLKNNSGDTVDDSDGTSNNYDTDWVKTQIYKVSLKKYVSKVTDIKGENEESYDRSATRLNDYAADKTNTNNYNTEKKNEPVMVEAGDKVTYTIILKNEGDTSVKINEIYDYYSNKGLEYDGSAIQGNGGGIITETTNIDPNEKANGNITRYKISFRNPIIIQAKGTTTVTITFKVVSNISDSTYCNVARINNLINKNNKNVKDGDGTDNNTDEDWIKLKKYAVSLEKYVYQVNGQNLSDANNNGGAVAQRAGKAEYLTYKDGKYVDETAKDTKYTKHNQYKYDNAVTVSNGNTVTYNIKVTNNGDTNVYITEIADYLPDGVIYNGVTYNDGQYNTQTNNEVKFTNLADRLILPGDSVEFTVRVEVIEDNKSNNILKNVAEITENGIKNRNEISVTDTTPNNNKDADYIIMNYPIPEEEVIDYNVEKVWNHGENPESERPTSITVKLYRDNVYQEGKDLTLTASNGWKGSWDGLEKKDADGRQYNYTAQEVVPENYTAAHDFLDGKTIITNTYKDDDLPPTSETISKTLNKVWLDTAGNQIEGSGKIKVQLYQNYKPYEGENSVVQLSSNNNWTHTWELPKYDANGSEYIYTVKEVNVPAGYDDIYVGDGFTIQNKQIEYTDITVKKGWADNNNEEGKRPNSVTVQLYKGEERVGEPVTLTENKDLDKNWTYTWTGLLQADYTVKEVDVPEGYIVSYVKEDTTTWRITNTYKDDDDPPSTPDLPGVISGYVWNDEAFNKAQTAYNGTYDLEEDPVDGVKVMLYRVEDNEVVATATTNINGYYSFSDADLALNTSLAEEEKYIKGKKVTYIDSATGEKVVTNIWASYYSYYVVFEYDGITYTSTEYSEFGSKEDNCLTSNAREKLDTESYDGKVVQSRTAFNNRYDTINSGGAYKANGAHTKYLIYDTENNSGYIPSSLYSLEKSYNHTINNQGEETGYRGMQYTILMQSSTDKIELSGSSDLEPKLQHVNIGLRGKDIFDLELTSDVAQIDVIINNQKGVYKYANKVTLRKQDVIINDDMANIRRESSNTYVDSQEQRIRETDMPALEEIKVTYKITVHNTSPTAGTATKITNYYDSKYTFVGAYATLNDIQNNNKLNIDNNLSKDPADSDKYGYKTIITNWDMIAQAETKEIYVVYELKDNTKNTLKDLESLATYNMAEIAEYRTECGTNQTEYSRGLLDKDSAPGSANREQVRLTTTEGQSTPTTGGNPTTVDYYFGGNDLSVLKYEDDTFATPTLYFVKDSSKRQITGTVFEDLTTVNSITRIKTGNGKLDEGEVGVYGAQVELIEQGGSGKTYGATTKADGTFLIEGFLPGNYIIRYTYGRNMETVLLNQSGDVNAKSYNGEDFQATNNTGTYGALKLDSTENYWYVYNEVDGISTAIDNVDRREIVSETVTNFIDEQMTVLNNMRDGKSAEDSKVTYTDNGTEKTIEVGDIIDDTYMFSETKSMLFTVEKIELINDEPIQKTEFAEYIIRNMNFGIAEVPVTIVDLQKYVSAFTITDSTGENIIASMQLEEKEDGTIGWKLKGDVLPNLNDNIDVSIENEELQGARLEVTYTVEVDINTEVNFDGKRNIVPTLTGLVDFVDNNLSYNEELGDNSKYWEVVTYDYISGEFAKQMRDGVTPPKGTVDPSGTKYTTILKAKDNSPLFQTAVGKGKATVTLEKVLTSTDSTIDGIITSTLDTSAYSNIVEIVGFDYTNTSLGAGEGAETDSNGDGIPDDVVIMRDRIRTKNRQIIIPGVQYDYTTSEILVIHPPTGDSSISMIYLLLAVVSLGILAAGVFGIKKFVIKK